MTLVMILLAANGVATPARSQSAAWVTTRFIGFNTTLPPFDNALMRRAVASAIDRAQLSAADQNFASRSLEPPDCLAHNPNARLHSLDSQKAKELIAQSGVNLDEAGPINLWYISRLSQRDTSKKELEILAANLQAIGLRVTFREFGNYEALKRIATLPVVKLQYWGVWSYVSACSGETFLEDLVHSKGYLNYFGYNNTQIDALIGRAKATGDRQGKIRLFQEAEQKILDDAILVPVWWWKGQ